MYNCTSCNYVTDKLFNYNKHLKTKKHLSTIPKFSKTPQHSPILPNTPNISHQSILFKKTQSTSSNFNINLMCKYCKITFSRSCNRSKHEKTCSEHKKNENKLLKRIDKNQIEYQFKIKDDETMRYKRMVTQLNRQVEKLTELLAKKSNGNNYINNYNFISTNYTKAQELTALNNYNNLLIKNGSINNDNDSDNDNNNDNEIEFEIEEMSDLENDQFIKDILAYKKLNSLQNVLGNFLIENYVKTDKSLQSIHVTDSSRMKYVYCTLKYNLKDTTIEWKSDPKGVNVSKIIVDPMLDFLKNKTHNFQQKLALKFRDEPKKINDDEYNYMEDSQTLLAMLSENNNKTKEYNLKKKIMDYITPHFEFNKIKSIL